MSYFKSVIFSLLVVLVTSLGAAASDTSETQKLNELALSHIENKEYEQALTILEPLALNANALAIYRIGYLYFYGFGIEQNQQKAVEYWLQAAQLGLDKAYKSLGYVYYHGLGATKDPNQSVDWYTKYKDAKALPLLYELALVYFDFADPKKREKGLAMMTKLANKNDQNAKFFLGEYYWKGAGDDIQKSIYWYKTLAEEGNHFAQNNLGKIYRFEESVRDLTTSINWYKLASSSGNADAQWNLGFIYRYGVTDQVPIDKGKAFELYQQAAQAGLTEAKLGLAELYKTGFGTKIDYQLAANWYISAADDGNSEAAYQFAMLLRRFKNNEKYAQAILNYLQKASDLNHPKAQVQLAKMYFSEDGVSKNIATSIFYLNKAIANQSSEASYLLARLYHVGEGVLKDIDQAILHYTTAAEQNDQQAIYALAKLYQSGNGVSKDLAKARQYFTRSVELGNEKAAFDLASMMYIGEGGSKNLVNARSLFIAAANRGHVLSQYFAGIMLKYGEGGEKNATQAFKWLLKVAEGNDKNAFTHVGNMYLFGEGTKSDKHKAYQWLTKAVNQTPDKLTKTDFFNLFLIVNEGWAKDTNRNKIKWLKNAVNMGHLESKFAYAIYLRDGTEPLINKNIHLAIKHFEEVARSDDADNDQIKRATRSLSNIYGKMWNSTGQNDKATLAKSVFWAEKAAAKGDKEAKRMVEIFLGK